jgi:hypothetical protein
VRRVLLLRAGFTSIVRDTERLGVLVPDYVAVMGLARFLTTVGPNRRSLLVDRAAGRVGLAFRQKRG